MASQTTAPSMAKPSEPAPAPPRTKKYDPKKPHITESPITKTNWYKHVNWLNVTLIIGLPIYGMIAAYWTPLHLKTAIWAFAYYFMTGLGITAGMSSSAQKSPAATNTRCRLPQIVGTYLILGKITPQDLPRGCWRWSSRRLNPMVVERSPRPSQIYRHRQGPILRSERSPLLAYWMDDHEAEPKAYWAYRHLRFE
jgi:hypothetical protein